MMSNASKAKPPRPPSAKAGNVDIIFRRPGSAAGKNPEPKSKQSKKPATKGAPGRDEDRHSVFLDGEEGADAALLRALKMAGIDRVQDENVRPSTAQSTRDALHSEEGDAAEALGEAYMAELSVAWDDAMAAHRPPTASAEARALVNGENVEDVLAGPSQRPGEFDLWRREDEPCDDADEVVDGMGPVEESWQGDWREDAEGEQSPTEALPQFSSGQANRKLIRRSASASSGPGTPPGSGMSGRDSKSRRGVQARY